MVKATITREAGFWVVNTIHGKARFTNSADANSYLKLLRVADNLGRFYEMEAYSELELEDEQSRAYFEKLILRRDENA